MCFTQAYRPAVLEAVESEAHMDVMYVVYPATRLHQVLFLGKEQII